MIFKVSGRRSSSISILFTILAVSGAANATKFTVSSAAGKTAFVAVGKPAMLRIKGDGPGPQGDLELADQKVSGTLKLTLDSLSTGLSMRDEHMKKKYLEVEKFPAAELTLKQVKLPELKVGATQKDVEFEGNLNLHGVNKTVKVKADVTATETGYKTSAKFDVLLSDFKIDIPSYAGIKVADNVQIEIAFDVKK